MEFNNYNSNYANMNNGNANYQRQYPYNTNMNNGNANYQGQYHSNANTNNGNANYQGQYPSNANMNNENANFQGNMNNEIDMPSAKLFNHYGKTDIGKVAKINEDYVDGFSLLNDSVMCLCISDGLGSVQGGQFSSIVAIQELKDYLTNFLTNDTSDHIKFTLYNAMYLVNRIIYNYQRLNPELYGSFISTITVAIINKNKEMVIGHVGNTRAYIIRDNAIYQMTRDDTAARDLVDSKELLEEEYPQHPDRNRLTKWLGATKLDPYINVQKLERGDLILLTTNGVFEMISDENIKNLILETGNSKKACETIVDISNEQGGVDNMGVMLSYIDF